MAAEGVFQQADEAWLLGRASFTATALQPIRKKTRLDDWRPLFFSAAFVTYAVCVAPTLDALALPSALQTLADLVQAAGLLMAIHFFLLFHDGRYVLGWTRLIGLGWAAYCLAWGLFPGMPLSLIDPFEASFGAFLILMFLGWTVGLVAQAVRYRRANSRQRTQRSRARPEDGRNTPGRYTLA